MNGWLAAVSGENVRHVGGLELATQGNSCAGVEACSGLHASHLASVPVSRKRCLRHTKQALTCARAAYKDNVAWHTTLLQTMSPHARLRAHSVGASHRRQERRLPWPSGPSACSPPAVAAAHHLLAGRGSRHSARRVLQRPLIRRTLIISALRWHTLTAATLLAIICYSAADDSCLLLLRPACGQLLLRDAHAVGRPRRCQQRPLPPTQPVLSAPARLPHSAVRG